MSEAKNLIASSYAKYKQGDYEGAIADINKVIGLTPPNAMLYYNRGVMKVKKGDLDEARADYEKAIALAPAKKEKFAPLLRDITSKMADTTTQILDSEQRSADGEQKTGEIEIPGYVIEAKLGEGGMGAVYKAKQVSLGRDVAIKVLAAKFGEDPKFVARFAREAKIAAQLNHKNIVSVLETGVAQGQHYYVMEYIEGISLASQLRKIKTMPEQAALKIIEEVAEALEHAAKHNIIHRDIKPDNIMLTKDGHAKLCDLGIAKQTQGELAKTLTLTGEGAFFTPAYVSPEQLTGEKLDSRSDIYSLGVTLYEMVTGRLPFTGKDAPEMASKRLTQNTVPPKKWNPKISQNLNNLILRMMARKKEHRPLNPTQLIKSIQHLRQGGRIFAPPKPYTKWVILAASVLVAVIAITIYFSRTDNQEEIAASKAIGVKERERKMFEDLYANVDKLLPERRFGEALTALGMYQPTDPDMIERAKGLKEKINKEIDKDSEELGNKIDALVAKKDEKGLDEMRLEIERNVGAYPKFAFVYRFRGVVKGKLGDYKGELEDDSNAISIDPNYAKAYVDRGAVKCDHLGDLKGAIDDFNKAISIDPNHAMAYNNRGVAKGKLGDYKSEFEDCSKAISIDPNLALAYVNRGNAKGAIGDNKGVLEDESKAISMNPNIANAYVGRGAAKGNLGDYAGAIADWEKAISLAPANKEKLQPYIDDARKKLSEQK